VTCYSLPDLSAAQRAELERAIREHADRHGLFKYDDLIAFVVEWTEKHGREGKRAIMCGDLGPKCLDCGNVSDALCDFPVGRRKTCDRSICTHCSPDLQPNLNYCAAHREEWERFRREHLPEVVTAQFGKRRVKPPKKPTGWR
jgi:predicted small metal-binding protein